MGLPGLTAERAIADPVDADPEEAARAKYRIAVPGLVSGEVGLGDVVGRAASLVGIASCEGCRHRARALNSWVKFSPRR